MNKTAKTILIVAAIVIIAITTFITVKRNSEKKRTRAFKEEYKDGKVLIYESLGDYENEGEYKYYDKIQRGVVLANKKDVDKTQGFVRIVAVKTFENGKNYTRRLDGYVNSNLLV